MATTAMMNQGPGECFSWIRAMLKPLNRFHRAQQQGRRQSDSTEQGRQSDSTGIVCSGDPSTGVVHSGE